MERERKQMTCDSFIFYRSFYEAISELPMEMQGRIYDAIFQFAFDGKDVELAGAEKAVMSLIKPQLIANRVRYENGCKGGRPRRNPQPNENLTETETKPKGNLEQTEDKPRLNQSATKTKPNENVNENNSQLKIIKKIRDSVRDAYTKEHCGLIDEVTEVLGKACCMDRSLRFNGVQYSAEDFQDIAERFGYLDLGRVCNSLLAYEPDIENREYYILGVIVAICGK